MRLDALLLSVLGLCASARAAEPVEPVPTAEPPDAALLEFLADWPEEDRQWLEVELNTTQSDGAQQMPPARETNHE